MLQSLRAFFAEREVMEVETPVLSPSAITDPQLQSFSTQINQRDYYLHTSPEFYMKRLLASGSGDIYQVARVFREDETGRYHSPEFSLLEWYRTGFDHHRLMGEVEDFLAVLFEDETLKIKRLSYQQAFEQALQIDPLEADLAALKQCVQRLNIEIPRGMETDAKDVWLDWLMVDKVAPRFAQNGFTFLYNYPASQAALARLDAEDPRVANRFELFYGELELANGFYELSDATEQLQRFNNENRMRHQRGRKIMPVDYALIAALDAGLPDCAGVAIGLDRLLMLLTQSGRIQNVMAFGNELGGE
ncbi:Translation elongation factor P Lys34--(R)-beta-lysine ligase [hydrothermal vent metagenome]|uniref:Translation elongation factor P Lys34--(R)-beta-lysine ligase n=1 Tax=hydrothermal vent metagenome TaxID=652676 RepID=A0A3B0XIY0_9ZZZZ